MISIRQAIDVCKETYDIKGVFYLSDFFSSNGTSKLYRWLESIYQTEYLPSDRIIVVQDCVDQYHTEDMPGIAITYLQQFAAQIDISNFFITIISTNKDIKSEVEQARDLYRAEDQLIQIILCDGEYNKTPLKSANTFCSLPWVHLHIGTDGNVLPCCQGDHRFPLGNVRDLSPESIFNSPDYVKLRDNMLQGIRSKECISCYKKEELSLPSLRMQSNQEWPLDASLLTSHVNLESIKFLDIRLSNLCNLKCRMCDGYFSSAIAQEQKELFNKPLVSTLSAAERRRALDSIINLLPTIEQIYFAGGEPLISSEHYEILNELIRIKRNKITISYNTNFTQLSHKGTSVIDLWQEFSDVNVCASIDARGKVAEYIRHGTNWAVIENNVRLVKSLLPSLKFSVTSAVGCMNIESLIELQKMWHNDKKLNIEHFSLTTITSPAYLTVRVLPLEHKHRLEQIITSHITWCRNNFAEKLATQWSDVLSYMIAQDDSHYLSEFRRLTNTLDAYRNESFKEVFPQLQDIL